MWFFHSCQDSPFFMANRPTRHTSLLIPSAFPSFPTLMPRFAIKMKDSLGRPAVKTCGFWRRDLIVLRQWIARNFLRQMIE
jgi:hypothetical protein